MKKSCDFFCPDEKKLRPSGKKLNRSKKSQFSSKAVRLKRDIRERNWIESKKITIFFKSGETKTGCSGEKLGRVNFFRISSKMVELNQSSRERNWAEVKNFGFLQKWW